MNYIVKLVILSAGILCFSVPFALSSMDPPQGVGEIIELMGEFEESFESGRWGEADESLGTIESQLSEVFAMSRLNDRVLENILLDLKKSIQVKDEKLTETNFILFQRQYFDFINNFYFEVHPILLVIEKYIVDEVAEALAERDFDDVVGEMREAANLMGHAEPIFLEKGISEEDVGLLKSKIIETIKAARKHDVQDISELLSEIKKLYLSLLERYKSL